MNSTPVITLFCYFAKPCYRLSFSDFLQLVVSYCNLCNLFMRHHNLYTYNAIFCILWCRTLITLINDQS